VPVAVGVQFAEYAPKAPPPTVPIETLLTKNSTFETWVPLGLVPMAVVALIVIVGVVPTFSELPVVGDVIEIVGVEWATVAATSAQTAANTRRREKAGGAEIALGTTRSASEQRWFMGGAPG
jgi:hypothetical protein